MSKAQKHFWILALIVIGPFLPNLALFSQKSPWTSMKKLEFNSGQKIIVAQLNFK